MGKNDASGRFPSSPSFGFGAEWDHSSCRYLESGLAFYSDRITACGVVHHGTGTPELARYSGGAVPFREITGRRGELIRNNQIGCESICNGCPNLRRRIWPPPSGKIDWVGITHNNSCNNACDYCWLQWAGNGRGRPDFPSATYSVLPAVREMLDAGVFSENLVVDYGGGGEPTLMPEIDALLRIFKKVGAEQWLHTNGVRTPLALRPGGIGLERIHILCSVDAGTPETYRAVKRFDHFSRVWENLFSYAGRGADLVVKYIVQGNNCSDGDIGKFVGLARQSGAAAIQWDIDLRFPDPQSEIIRAIAYLCHLAEESGLAASPANVGVNSADRLSLGARLAAARAEMTCLALSTTRI